MEAYDDDEFDDILADQIEAQECRQAPSPPPFDQPAAAAAGSSGTARDSAPPGTASAAVQASGTGEVLPHSGSMHGSAPSQSQLPTSQLTGPEFNTAGEEITYPSSDEDSILDGYHPSNTEGQSFSQPAELTQRAAAAQRAAQAEADAYSEGLHMDVSLGSQRLNCRVRNARSNADSRHLSRPTHSGQLLTTPIAQLMQEVRHFHSEALNSHRAFAPMYRGASTCTWKHPALD